MKPGKSMPSQPIAERLGICQWFHYQAYEDVRQTLVMLKDLGVRHLRTGISWADLHRPGGLAWYDWQMRALAGADLEVLLSVWHTPPSLSQDGTCTGPPRRLKDYADAIDYIINRWGDCFGPLELWNEPNNLMKWNFAALDPDWSQFGRMIAMAGHWAQRCGKTTVLGGMMPVDHHWLALMKRHGALEHIDVIAIHSFPDMWWPDAPCWDWPERWHGWDEKLDCLRPHVDGRPIWITETGLATWDLPRARLGRHALQAQRLEEAALAPAERTYWYCLLDLPPHRSAIEGFHVDENEYHMGLVTHRDVRKPAYGQMRDLLAESAASYSGGASSA